MTAQTPGCGSNSEARKRAAEAADPHSSCEPGTCKAGDHWRSVPCPPHPAALFIPASVPDDLPELDVSRDGMWVIPGPGPITAELERLDTIGKSLRHEISDQDWEWFCAHPLSAAVRVQWGEVIPTLLEWMRRRGGDGVAQATAPQPTEGGAPTEAVPSHVWRGLAETLVKNTRWDKWRREGLRWQHERITELAEALERWMPESDAVARLLAARSQRPEGVTVTEQALAAHREEWASYIENWDMAVGPRPPSVQGIVRALRGPVPFGVSAGDTEAGEGRG